MPGAFVLLNTELGSEDSIVKELRNLEGVKEVFQVYGVYDIIVKVNADDKEELQRKVLLIRRLDDIKSTLTLLEINSSIR